MLARGSIGVQRRRCRGFALLLDDARRALRGRGGGAALALISRDLGGLMQHIICPIVAQEARYVI